MIPEWVFRLGEPQTPNMTPYRVYAALLASCWYSTPAQAGNRAKHDVALAINAALQDIWHAPKAEPFTRAEQSFATAPGTDTYALAASVARVLGDVRCLGRTLTEVASLSGFRDRATNFDLTAGETTPRYYHVARSYAGAGSSNREAMEIALLLGPTPAATLTVTFRAAMEPPSYSACDLENTDSGAIPMPHSRAESLLLPLARYHMLDSSYVQDPKLRAEFADNGERVLVQLGYTEPSQAKRKAKGDPALT